MNQRLTLRVLGGLLLFLGLGLLTPIPVALIYGDGQVLCFLASAAVTAGCGGALFKRIEARGDLTHREGFAIVTFGWIAFAFFGGLPYVVSGSLPNPVDAYFEAMSGFTTTGATAIADLTTIPPSVLFWRSMTQWLGGMGIIVLSLAILPFLGVGGMQLFEAEVPGPTADRLTPRVQDTAKVLWVVYFILTVVETLLLWVGEMDLFEAINHSLTTMATGGFSTRNRSVAEFESGYEHVVITVFMFLAGVNFSLHFHALRGDVSRYWKSDEFKFYLGIVVVASLAIAVLRIGEGSFGIGLRDAAFQVASLMTTTGYVTADYEVWPVATQYVLVTLMFVGGCAGSTGGGIKVVRVLLVIKHAFLQVSRLIHPREVRSIRLDHAPVSPEVVQSVLGFVALFFGVFLHASLAMSLLGYVDPRMDLETAGGSVIACLGNIGPGMGHVGPTDHFAWMPSAGKLILSLCMLVGRLELFTVFVLLVPSFWRK